mmetsp:Transcript_29272/g.63521  ORF Transcript_29272/g.63521 Transcript_29272/m.63521 type:complete len:143 (+) Transcript_29272:103-531(+)|eukprot:CAMPEP_0178656276 /NCGR_PEP_ID=MMETSP0698-20121128/24727_1 /TAXON_ID=265572 /ORGANISM="Extubocellulus spinifer, Strain CCMP396" /LENGTH=142 /DNA_ID=CAMNT_0020298299 /DNA_START=32 /DNA_END=457 /DNA_ORIENTATION=-
MIATICWALFYLHIAVYLWDGCSTFLNTHNWVLGSFGPKSAKAVTTGAAEVFAKAAGGVLISYQIQLLLTVDPVADPILSLTQILPHLFVGTFAVYAYCTDRYHYDAETQKVPGMMVGFHAFLVCCILTRFGLAMTYLQQSE